MPTNIEYRIIVAHGHLAELLGCGEFVLDGGVVEEFGAFFVFFPGLPIEGEGECKV